MIQYVSFILIICMTLVAALLHIFFRTPRQFWISFSMKPIGMIGGIAFLFEYTCRCPENLAPVWMIDIVGFTMIYNYLTMILCMVDVPME